MASALMTRIGGRQTTERAQNEDIGIHLKPTSVAADGPYVFGSTICRAEHFLLPLYFYWCGKLNLQPVAHRKPWELGELVFIMQTLHEHGKLTRGFSGLGFGVGQEPISTCLAGLGIDVLATDLNINSDDAQAAGWVGSNQNAATPDSVYCPDITEREVFDRHFRFANVDMNAIPDDLKDIDFCWSACCLEHLGNLHKGLAFIENSLATLKPGGIAIHTTEFNLSSDVETLEQGGTVLYREAGSAFCTWKARLLIERSAVGTVLYRKQDILHLERLLRTRGHRLLPLNFYAGATELDSHVCVPPYSNDRHLRLEIGRYKATSIGLAIVKKESTRLKRMNTTVN